VEIVGLAHFANADDESGVMYEASVASHEGRFWIVATWIEPPWRGERIPEWLLPVDAVGLSRSGERGPWVGAGVPKQLAGPNAELAAMQRAGAVLNPLLAGTRTRGPLH
jgi:hypothetical protein